MILGIDEVGRGCWAGPLVAAAVLMDSIPPGLKDSKLLSRQQRQILSQTILTTAAQVGLGWVDAYDLDKIGLSASVRLAMLRAASQISREYSELIIDGNINFLPEYRFSRAIVAADRNIPQVSAASIVAKVARDTFMIERADKSFPDYGFSTHVGYGTALHLEKISQLGLTKLHRRSYRPIMAYSAHH